MNRHTGKCYEVGTRSELDRRKKGEKERKKGRDGRNELTLSLLLWGKLSDHKPFLGRELVTINNIHKENLI